MDVFEENIKTTIDELMHVLVFNYHWRYSIPNLCFFSNLLHPVLCVVYYY